MAHAPGASSMLNSSSSALPRPPRHTASLLPPRLGKARQYTINNAHHAADVRLPMQPESRRGCSLVTAAAKKADNPDLDEIELDESYYQEIGMTKAEAIRQQRGTYYAVDPEAVALDDISSIDSSNLPQEWKERLEAIENLQVYGPPALVMAGFRAEEYAVARALLDSVGAHEVKLLPASQELLQAPVAVALSQPEVDWSSPRPPEWILGGAWGSQRTILFSGLSLKTQATILELLEAQGLPQQICVTMALEDDQHQKLGDVMAAAVQAQRGSKTPPTVAPWEVAKTASSSSSTGTPSSSSSSSSTKKSLLSGMPGKRGPLFARKPGAGSKLPNEGLESLKDLISPEMARSRLQASGGDAGLVDLIDLGIPDDESDNAQLQQQQQQQRQQLPFSSSSSNQNADARSQALLDWITDDATGEVVELPWTEDEQQTAAAVSRMAQEQQRQQPQGNQDSELPVSLDELLPQAAPPPAAAAASDSSSSFWILQQQQQQGYSTSRQAGLPSSSRGGASVVNAPPAAAVGIDEIGDADLSGPSVFATIQAALKSGVDPETLKQVIDQAAAAGAAAADPIDLLLQEDVAKAEAEAATAAALKAASKERTRSSTDSQLPKSSSSSDATDPCAPAAATAAAPVAAFGPAPPPAGSTNSSKEAVDADDPMFKLRPEIQRAFENQQIKFVDMTKLPSKYKKQYTLAAMQERQRAQQQQLQQQDEEVTSQQVANMSEEEQQQLLDVAEGQQQQQRWWQQQQQSQQQQALRGGLSSNVSGSMPKGELVELDVEEGKHMQQGYDIENNMLENEEDDELHGVSDDAEDSEEALYLDEAKLKQLVDSASQEGLDITQTLAQALAYGVQIEPEIAAAVGVQLPSADVVAAAHREIAGSIREMQMQQAVQGEADHAHDDDEEAEVTAQTTAKSSSSSSSSKPRQWGSGLGAAVGRAKARLAQKKRQQS